MTNKNVFSKISAVVAVAAFALLAIPAISSAANYGYVNHSGNVMMYSANNASDAIRFAPNISARSGVILLDSQADTDLLGDHTFGV